MTADDQTTRAAPVAGLLANARRRSRSTIRRGLLLAARPYARRRSRQAELSAALGRLQDEFEHVRKRHTEQIERVEDLLRELILATEALRRRISDADRAADPAHADMPHAHGAED
jgi:hypothetical protein